MIGSGVSIRYDCEDPVSDTSRITRAGNRPSALRSKQAEQHQLPFLWKPLATAHSGVVVPRFQFLCDLLEKLEVAFWGQNRSGRKGTPRARSVDGGVLGLDWAGFWSFKLEGEDPEVDGRGEGP